VICSRKIFLAIILSVSFFGISCNRPKATIAPKLTINKKSAEMGTPIEVTYSFSTKKEYVPLNKDLTVFVHFLDPKRVRRFQDDHQPPKPTSEWRSDGNYNYTRTVFIPRNIPAGEYRIEMGIYNPQHGDRLVMEAKDADHRSYDMGTLLVEIPPQEPVVQYSQGWYDPEMTPGDIGNHWRWTKKDAVLKVKNPQADALLYVKLDGVPDKFQERQNVTISIGDQVIDTFPITSNEPVMKKYPVAKNVLGDGRMLEVKLSVDKTFIPASDNSSKDTRELGVRVYQLYLGKATD
jgi:hypothetical protein